MNLAYEAAVLADRFAREDQRRYGQAFGDGGQITVGDHFGQPRGFGVLGRRFGVFHYGLCGRLFLGGRRGGRLFRDHFRFWAAAGSQNDCGCGRA